MKERDRRTKQRIPNKTRASLENIIAMTARGRRFYQTALDRNEQKFMDPILTMSLARMGDVIDDIQRTARLALAGSSDEEQGDVL